MGPCARRRGLAGLWRARRGTAWRRLNTRNSHFRCLIGHFDPDPPEKGPVFAPEKSRAALSFGGALDGVCSPKRQSSADRVVLLRPTRGKPLFGPKVHFAEVGRKSTSCTVGAPAEPVKMSL